MEKKLFLLDGMALVYRAHFALIARPIFTSKGMNTSALYGFTQTLLDILKNQQPTHIAVAFDTEAPTHRHKEFADYKATRQAMPEDLSAALPHVRRLLQAFRIPALTCDGFEADDIIGTLVRRAGSEGYQCFMVTPDKDFGQLITENVLWYKPSRMGDSAEVLGLPEIRQRWNIQRPEQVVDVLALMGDASDNIPGVPGIGEKTAMKLISQFGSVEALLARAGELTGKLKTNVEQNRDIALASKRLATIVCDAPCMPDLDSLKVQPADDQALKALLVEFEFNSIGKRLYGDDFKAGRGFSPVADVAKPAPGTPGAVPREEEPLPPKPAPGAVLTRLADTRHHYSVVKSAGERAALLEQLAKRRAFAFAADIAGEDLRDARLAGMAFAVEPHRAWYVPLPSAPTEAAVALEPFRAILGAGTTEITGHNLKSDLRVLRRYGVSVEAKLFDVMIAHSLLEPDMRHTLEYLAEAFLGYTPVAQTGSAPQQELALVLPVSEKTAEEASEEVDLVLQLRVLLEPLLKQKHQERVFYEIESPLVSVLADMEHEGIAVNAGALSEFGNQLAKEIDALEKGICRLAGTDFNVNSPRQLGQILFEVLKIGNAPKKTKTGQYATDEQTLASLAPDHEIVRMLLDHRAAVKLKSTYADALPLAIWPATGRIHTTYNQVMTSTGRLNSQNPNLQNIPIRTERGQEIRKAFTSREPDYLLLSADYSQIELRVIAALSHEPGLLEALRSGVDVHAATAARVFGVPIEAVTPEMRRKAKMVNYGIAYGISAFGLAQRLGIPRKEGAEIIDEYFKQFAGIREYMDRTIAFAREHGYVETVTGRRRYIRDIRSSNNTVRAAAERNAINAPIQGSAADMIKIAMVNIHRELQRTGLKTRMLLQVHDELVFDLYIPERETVMPLVEDKMKNAITLDVPIEVEIGTGRNWIEAH